MARPAVELIIQTYKSMHLRLGDWRSQDLVDNLVFLSGDKR